MGPSFKMIRGSVRLIQLFKFSLVGLVGFAVDALILTLSLRHLTPNIYASRLLSFSAAVLATYTLNRTFVFAAGASATMNTAEYGRYLAVQVLGAAANLAVFAALIEAYPPLRSMPIVPLGLGAIIGLVINFVGSKLWVFRRSSHLFL